MSQFGGLFTTKIANIFTGGRRKFDSKNLPSDAFSQVYSSADAAELLKAVVDAKNELQIAPALEMITKMLHESRSAAIELAENGVCGIMDTLLSNCSGNAVPGRCWSDTTMTSRILAVILKMIEDPPSNPSSSEPKKARRRSSEGENNFSVAGDKSIAKNESLNVNKIRSTFSGSATIFRLVKLAPSIMNDDLSVTLLLQILTTIARSADALNKLISSGTCELAVQWLRNTPLQQPQRLATLCDLINTIVMTDLDKLDSQHHCQERFAHLQLCEYLVSMIVQAQTGYFTKSDNNHVNDNSRNVVSQASLLHLDGAVRLLGSLGRWNEEVKERLFRCNLPSIFPWFVTYIALLNDDTGASLSESVSWCVANVTYPNMELQSSLGNLGVVNAIVKLLETQATRPSVLFEVCRALRNLCFLHDENLQRAVEESACLERVQQLLRQYEEMPEVLQWLMFALAALASYPPAIEHLNRLDMPSQVVSILRKYAQDADIVQWTALVVSSLASHDSAQNNGSGNTIIVSMAEHLAAMNCGEALAKCLSQHMEDCDVLEEILHAAAILAQHSITCRRYFLKTGFVHKLFSALQMHFEQSEALAERALSFLRQLLPVASETQSHTVSLQRHFFGLSVASASTQLRQSHLRSDYLHLVAKLDPQFTNNDWYSSDSNTSSRVMESADTAHLNLKLLLQVISKYAKNETVAECATQFLAGVSSCALSLVMPHSLEIQDDTFPLLWFALQHLRHSHATSTSTVVAATQQQQQHMWSLAALRWPSAFRTGLSSFFLDMHLHQMPHGSDISNVLDTVCDAGGVQSLLSLLQMHALENEAVCLFGLQALLQLLSHPATLGHVLLLTSHSSSSSANASQLHSPGSAMNNLCNTLAAIATHYSLQSPALVILSYACCVQLCYEPVLRALLLQNIAENGCVNFVLHSLAHSLGNTEIVRLSCETLAVLGLGPQHDALACVSKHSALLMQQRLSADFSGTKTGSQTMDNVAGKEDTGSETAEENNANNDANNSNNSQSTNIGGNNSGWSFAQRLRRVLSAPTGLSLTQLTQSLTGSLYYNFSSAANYAVESQLTWQQQPLGALDTVLWSTPSNSAGNNAAVASALVDAVCPLALIALVTFQHQQDFMTLISVVNALQSLAVDTDCRAKLIEQTDVFFTTLRILKATLFGAKSPADLFSHPIEVQDTADDTATCNSNNNDGNKEENENEASYVVFEAKEVVENKEERPLLARSYQDAPPKDVLLPLTSLLDRRAPPRRPSRASECCGGNAADKEIAEEAQRRRRSLLCTLILHFVASSCLPFSENNNVTIHSNSSNSNNLSERRSLHIQRLIQEMEVFPLLCYVLRYYRNDVCLCEAALRCLHLLLHMPYTPQLLMDLQNKFSEVEVEAEEAVETHQATTEPPHVSGSSLECIPASLVVHCLRHSYSGSSAETSPRLSYYAMLALASLCEENGRLAMAVGELDGCRQVARIFGRHGDWSQEMARACCQAVCALKPLNPRLGSLGVCAMAVQALQTHAGHTEAAMWACRAISSLAEYDRNKVDLDAHDVCRAVVQALQRHVSGFVSGSDVSLMGSLSLNLNLGLSSASTNNIIHNINSNMDSAADSPVLSNPSSTANNGNNNSNIITTTTAAAGYGSVSNISSNSSGNGVINTAVYATRASAAGVAQWSCTAIYFLARGRQDTQGRQDSYSSNMQHFQQQLVSFGACEAVAKALLRYADTDDSVSQACFRALVVLLLRNPAAQTRLGNLGVCAAVVEALHLFPSNAEVAEWGCRAVAVLAESHDTNIAKLALAGACETIPVVLQAHPANEHVAVAGCDVISFMSETLSNGFAERFGHSGACEAVVAALKKHYSHSALLTARCSIALATLARVQGNARWFGPAGGCEAVGGALLQHWQDSRCAKFIIVAVGNLCAVEFNKERLGNLGVCEVVVQAAKLHCEDTDTARACATAIWKICETFALAANKMLQNNNNNISNNNNKLSLIVPEHTSDNSTGAVSDPITESNNSNNSDVHNAYNNNNSSSWLLSLGCTNRFKLQQAGVCEALEQCLAPNYYDLDTAVAVCRAVYVLCQGPGLICETEREQFYRLQMASLIVKTMQYHARASLSSSNSNNNNNNSKKKNNLRNKMRNKLSKESTTQQDTPQDQEPEEEEDDLSQPYFANFYEDLARFGCLSLASLCGASRRYVSGVHRGNQRLVQKQLYSAHLLVHLLRHYRHPLTSLGSGLGSSGGSGLSGSYANPQYHLLIVEAALSAIRSVCLLHEENKTLFGQAHVCEALLEILDVHGRSFDLVLLTTQALFSVTDGHDANRLTLCYSGAAELLCAGLQRYLSLQNSNSNNNSNNNSTINSNAGNTKSSSNLHQTTHDVHHSTSYSNNSNNNNNNFSTCNNSNLEVLVEHVLAVMLGLALHPVGRSRLLATPIVKIVSQQVLTAKMLSVSMLPPLQYINNNNYNNNVNNSVNNTAVAINHLLSGTSSGVQQLLRHGHTQQCLAQWRIAEYLACLGCALLSALAFKNSSSSFHLASSPSTAGTTLHHPVGSSLFNFVLNNNTSANSNTIMNNNNSILNNANMASNSLSQHLVKTLAPLLQRACLMHVLSLQQQLVSLSHSPSYQMNMNHTNSNTNININNDKVVHNVVFVSSLAPKNCSTTRFLHGRVDLVQETCRALYFLCLYSTSHTSLHFTSTSQNCSNHSDNFNEDSNNSAIFVDGVSSPKIATDGWESETRRLAIQLGVLDTLSSFLSAMSDSNFNVNLHLNNNFNKNNGTNNDFKNNDENEQTDTSDHNNNSNGNNKEYDGEEEMGDLYWAQRLLDLLLNNNNSNSNNAIHSNTFVPSGDTPAVDCDTVSV